MYHPTPVGNHKFERPLTATDIRGDGIKWVIKGVFDVSQITGFDAQPVMVSLERYAQWPKTFVEDRRRRRTARMYVCVSYTRLLYYSYRSYSYSNRCRLLIAGSDNMATRRNYFLVCVSLHYKCHVYCLRTLFSFYFFVLYTTFCTTCTRRYHFSRKPIKWTVEKSGEKYSSENNWTRALGDTFYGRTKSSKNRIKILSYRYNEQLKSLENKHENYKVDKNIFFFFTDLSFGIRRDCRIRI